MHEICGREWLRVMMTQVIFRYQRYLLKLLDSEVRMLLYKKL